MLLRKRILKNYLIQIIRLNNGPLICNKNSHNKELILNLIMGFIRKKFGRLILVSPSYIYDDENLIKRIFTLKLKIEPWATSLIKLDMDEFELLIIFKTKMEEYLKKGLKICEIKEVTDFRRIPIYI